jgi:hypothetical protein
MCGRLTNENRASLKPALIKTTVKGKVFSEMA